MKKRAPGHLGPRHAKALRRAWAILATGQPSVARFERFERAHRRLLALRFPLMRTEHRILDWLLTPIDLFPGPPKGSTH